MNRRAFLGGLALGSVVVPLAAEAQPTGKIPRIGVLVTGPPPAEHVCVLALRQGLADLGYVEGRTHVLEIRWADGRPEKTFPRLGAELVRLDVDLIVAVTGQGLVEAKLAIASVPVVMAASTHPVELRVVDSLGHPRGNITGLASIPGRRSGPREGDYDGAGTILSSAPAADRRTRHEPQVAQLLGRADGY
jgi:putative ABC transport system substrate-binding protein